MTLEELKKKWDGFDEAEKMVFIKHLKRQDNMSKIESIFFEEILSTVEIEKEVLQNLRSLKDRESIVNFAKYVTAASIIILVCVLVFLNLDKKDDNLILESYLVIIPNQLSRSSENDKITYELYEERRLTQSDLVKCSDSVYCKLLLVSQHIDNDNLLEARNLLAQIEGTEYFIEFQYFDLMLKLKDYFDEDISNIPEEIRAQIELIVEYDKEPYNTKMRTLLNDLNK